MEKESDDIDTTESERPPEESVDGSRSAVMERRHKRTMDRSIRWPLHSNTPRITF